MAYPPETKEAARQAFIAALVGGRKSPWRDARRAVGDVPQRTVNSWAREWQNDPQVIEAVKERASRFVRRAEWRVDESLEYAHSVVKADPKKLPKGTLTKLVAVQRVIGGLSVLARVADENGRLLSTPAGSGEPTPQQAASLVREKFGHVTPTVTITMSTSVLATESTAIPEPKKSS
jgi:hypothetical protein